MISIVEINEQIKQAMKNQNKNRLSTLRILKSDIIFKIKELKNGEQIDNNTLIGVVQKTLRKYQEELEFIKDEIKINNLKESIVFLEGLLPKQLSKEELFEIVSKVVRETNIIGNKIGEVMKTLSKELNGKADMKEVKQMVDEIMKKEN